MEKQKIETIEEHLNDMLKLYRKVFKWQLKKIMSFASMSKLKNYKKLEKLRFKVNEIHEIATNMIFMSEQLERLNKIKLNQNGTESNETN